MTSALYLTSIEPAGKTALAAALGKNLLSQKKKVGFFLPLELKDSSSSKMDAVLIKEILDLPENIGDIEPISVSPMELWTGLSDAEGDFLRKIKEKYNKIAADKDVVIIEGLSGLITDGSSTLACYKIADLLNASVIVLLRYSDSLKADILHKVKQELGDRLAGVVLNFVPKNKIDLIKTDTAALFAENGIKVLAIIPEERALLGITVADLAKKLEGRILTAANNTNQLIENFMLGAMTPGSGIDYFSRKTNKAAIIRGERADMQLAALETSTACLVLTGSTQPLQAVIYNAEQKKVPIVAVSGESSDVINKIEKILSGSLVNNQQKLQKFQQLNSDLDYKSIYLAAGLAG